MGCMQYRSEWLGRLVSICCTSQNTETGIQTFRKPKTAVGCWRIWSSVPVFWLVQQIDWNVIHECAVLFIHKDWWIFNGVVGIECTLPHIHPSLVQSDGDTFMPTYSTCLDKWTQMLFLLPLQWLLLVIPVKCSEDSWLLLWVVNSGLVASLQVQMARSHVV